MIDTLKLSKRLQAAAMPAEQADAIAQSLRESLRRAPVTCDHLDARFAEFRTAIEARLRAVEIHLACFIVGAELVSVVVNHFWK